jgi:hypothetical protein
MAYEDAATFLARALPWPPLAALQPEWFVNIHTPRTYKGKTAFGGRACTTVREAINYIGWIQGDPARATDVYVCMSAQHIAKSKIDRRGRSYWTVVRGINNACWHKSFYVDIDVKPTGFPDPGTAMAELGQFVDAVGLPMPSYIVASGSGGCHVHWVIDEPVVTARWLPVAQALVSAMRHHQFAVDYPCTTDAARLLRVPNTFNYKHKPPAPVELRYADTEYTLDRIESVLLTYKSTLPVRQLSVNTDKKARSTLPPGFGPIAGNLPFRELAPNQDEALPPLPSLLALSKACPFVDQAVITGGRGYPQPLWYETAKLAFHTSKGVQALHDMAVNHADYTVQKNNELYERIVRERTPENKYGWPLCATLEAAGARECPACPWKIARRTDGKSPFHFVGEDYHHPLGQQPTPTVTPEVTSTFGALPDRYYYKPDATVWIDLEVKDKDSNLQIVPTQVCPHPIRNLKPIEDTPSWKVMFETCVAQHDWVPIIVPTNKIKDMRAFIEILSGPGMVMELYHYKFLEAMLTSFVQQLRERKEHTIPAEPLGWSMAADGTNGDAFVFGGIRHNCKGNTPAMIINPAIKNQYTPRGELEPWRRAMKMINDMHRPALEALIAAAFGAVFVEFTGERGLTICGCGNTGVYKSTSMRVGQTIYGSLKGLLAVDETPISVNSKLGHLRNLPVLWDEVHTQEAAIAMAKLMFSLGQGKSRQRSGRDGEVKDVNEWATLMIVASNSSLIAVADDYAKTTAAGLYRVFEFVVPTSQSSTGYTNEAGRILHALNYNYGMAGAILAQWLGKNAGIMLDLVQSSKFDVEKELGSNHGERNWIAAVTSIILGAGAANQLQLAQFDLVALKDFLYKEFDRLRHYRDNSGSDIERLENVREILSTFLNRNRRGFLWTDIMPIGPGKPQRATIANIEQVKNANRLVAQWAQQQNVMRIDQASFNEFLKQEHWVRQTIHQGLKNKFGMKNIRGTIGSGTEGPWKSWNVAADLLQFDLTHPDLQGIVEQ